MTYSPVRSMLRQVSLGGRVPSGCRLRRDTQMRHVGGSDDTPVKNENGARFAEPSSFSVDVQAIGRGKMVATCHAYAASEDSAAGSTFTTAAPRSAGR